MSTPTQKQGEEAYKKLVEQNKQMIDAQFEQIKRRRMLEKNINVLEIINEQQWATFKELIRPQFGIKSNRLYRISEEGFLKIYDKVYVDNSSELNLIELGILSDMLFMGYDFVTPVIVDSEGRIRPQKADTIYSIRDFLEFKVEMKILYETYHRESAELDKVTER